jgi:hypothetical protein
MSSKNVVESMDTLVIDESPPASEAHSGPSQSPKFPIIVAAMQGAVQSAGVGPAKNAKEEQLRVLRRQNEVLTRTCAGLKDQIRVIIERYDAKHKALDNEEKERQSETQRIRQTLTEEENRWKEQMNKANQEVQAKQEALIRLRVEKAGLSTRVAELEKRINESNMKHARLTMLEYGIFGYRLWYMSQINRMLQQQINQLLAGLPAQGTMQPPPPPAVIVSSSSDEPQLVLG